MELEYQGNVTGYHQLQDSLVRKAARNAVEHTYESGDALDVLEMLGLIEPLTEIPDYREERVIEVREHRRKLGIAQRERKQAAS